jgi:hypothetical protein
MTLFAGGAFAGAGMRRTCGGVWKAGIAVACDTDEPRRPPGQPMTMINSRGILALTAGQMREVDRIMAEDLHIELVQMMENAGRSLA